MLPLNQLITYLDRSNVGSVFPSSTSRLCSIYQSTGLGPQPSPTWQKGHKCFSLAFPHLKRLKWLCYSSSQHGTEVESSAPLYMTPSKAETTGGLRMPCGLLGFIHIKKSNIKNVFGVKPHTTSAYQIINPAVYSQMASPQVSCLNSSDELDPKRSWVCFLDYERR